MTIKYALFKGWKEKILSFLSEDDRKAVIFINIREHLDKIIFIIDEIIKEIKGEVLFVCFNSELPVYFRRLDINLKLSEDYLSDADYNYIDEYAIGLTRTWYLVKDRNNKGITEYENIHLGSLTEFSFQEFLICRIKNLEVINKVISLENPYKIITMEDTGELGDVAKIVSQVHNKSLLSLTTKPLFNSLRILKTKVRANLSRLIYLSILDQPICSLVMLTRLRNMVIIDPRAYAMLTGQHQLKNFIFSPIERGLSNRLYCFRRRRLYISFGIPPFGKISKRIEEQRNKFFIRWNELSSDPAFRQSFVYKDMAIWNLVEDKLCQFFKERFQRVLGVMAGVEEFHRRKTIRSIVLRADGRETEKTIIMAAQRLSIPTLYITHGVLSQNNGHDILYCNKTAVWGQADFERYISLGNSIDKLAITGSPKYDRLYFKRFDISKELVYKRLRLNPQRNLIILATQPILKFSSYKTDDENEVLLRSVLSAIKDIPDAQLVIKLHPFEDCVMYKKVLKETNANDIVLVKSIDIFSLIDASALLLVFSSTVGLEAMILNKPLITINLGRMKDSLPFAERGASLGVYRAIDIRPAIERILKDQELNKQLESKRKEILSHYIYKLDGRSSERVVEMINRMGSNAC